MYKETTDYVICRTARKIHQYMTRLLAEHNITPEQWVVLQIVANEENLSQQELSCRLEKLKSRKPGQPHPFVIGKEKYSQYEDVFRKMAKDAIIKFQG